MPENYEVVDYEDHEFEEGDTFQQVYDIEFPGWMPNAGRNEILDTLLEYATKLENALTDNLADGNEVSVQNTELNQVDDDTHRYIVTYNVEEASAQEPITGAGIWFIIYGVLIVLGIVGIAWVLRETRKLIESPGGSAALAGLLAVGAYGIYAYRQGPKDQSQDDPPPA